MNTILIKHGSSVPANGKLQNYELGYVDNGALYIGYNGNSVQLTDPKLLSLIDSNSYLKIPAIASTTTNTDKILVCNSNNVVYYKSAANILSEIKALPLAGGTVTGSTTFNKSLIVNSNSTAAYALKVGGAQFIDGASLTITEAYGTSSPKISLGYDKIILNTNFYGSTDPNTAGIKGTAGQIYFVIQR